MLLPAKDRVLMQLFSYNRPEKLSTVTNLSKAQVYRILGELERDGYVKRYVGAISGRGRPSARWRLTRAGLLRSQGIRLAWLSFWVFLLERSNISIVESWTGEQFDVEAMLALGVLSFLKKAGKLTDFLLFDKLVKWGYPNVKLPSRVYRVPIYSYECPLQGSKTQPSLKTCGKYPCSENLSFTTHYGLCFAGGISQRRDKKHLRDIWSKFVRQSIVRIYSKFSMDRLERLYEYYQSEARLETQQTCTCVKKKNCFDEVYYEEVEKKSTSGP